MRATINGQLVDLEILDGKKTSQEQEQTIITDTTWVRTALEQPAGVFTDKKTKFQTIKTWIQNVVNTITSGFVESVVAGNAITVDNTDPQNPVVNALTPPLTDGVLNPGGGRVTWLQNYDYEGSASDYVIGGVIYNTGTTQMTLSASDPALDRIDDFVLTALGWEVVEGTPSVPPVLEPEIDTTTQLKRSFAYVTAASTQPTLPTENIYLENTEWVTADNTANINLASNNNPYAGTVDIEGTNVANGNFMTFTPATFPSLITLDSFVFKIRSKAAWNAASRLVFQFRNGTTLIGNAVNFGNLSYGFVSSQTSSYQNINIPLTDFGNVAAATNLRIIKTGSGTIGFYLDNIQMVGENSVVVTPQVQSDWNETNNALPSFIRNKPFGVIVVASKLNVDCSSVALINLDWATGCSASNVIYIGFYVDYIGGVFDNSFSGVMGIGVSAVTGSILIQSGFISGTRVSEIYGSMDAHDLVGDTYLNISVPSGNPNCFANFYLLGIKIS